MITIYHNPRCSKSREALKLLENNNEEFEIKEYLKEGVTFKEIGNLLVKLHIKAIDLIRQDEPLFKKKFSGKKFQEEEWIQIMVENPVLIQRPIIIKKNTAVIGRPVENIYPLLNKKS